jgi:phosphate transport system substrate-binding protein
MNASNTTTNTSADDLQATRRARKRSTVSTGIAVVLAVVLLLVGVGVGYAVEKSVGGSSSSGSSSVTLSETGSTLIFPAMNLWGPAFTNYTGGNVHVTTAGTGSGTGISSAEGGLVDIGGTDAYLAPSTAASYNLINVPSAISAQLVFYNLPGLNSHHLNLNGTILAMIWEGTITNWNNPLIAAANPGVNLPSNPITPLHRSDGSGDTFMFSSLMFMSWSGWTHGFGTTISWISSSPGYQGNGGMVSGLQATPYGIAYIGISYLAEAAADGLGYAALGDNLANSASGGLNPANYIMPTPQNISYDANLALQNLQPPSVAITLILGGVPGAVLSNGGLGKGGSNPTSAYPTPYPDVNLEYLLVSTAPASPSHQYYVVAFLHWILSFGQQSKYLGVVSFLPLTAEVIGYDMEAIGAVNAAK